MVICAVLISYMSSQKGEFIIISHTRLLCMPCGEEIILQITSVHVLSLTMNIFDKVRNINFNFSLILQWLATKWTMQYFCVI